MATMPGGCPISSVPSMSKLTKTMVAASHLEAHGLPVGQPDLLGLIRLEDEPLGENRPRCPPRFLVQLGRPGISVDEALTADDGQPDTPVQSGVANDGLGLAARRHHLGLLEELAPHH